MLVTGVNKNLINYQSKPATNRVAFQGKADAIEKTAEISLNKFDRFFLDKLSKAEWIKHAVEKLSKEDKVKTFNFRTFKFETKLDEEKKPILESGYKKLKFWSLPITSFLLSGTHMLSTARSKKIEKEEKLPLILNTAACLTMATAGYFTVDRLMEKGRKTFTKYIQRVHEESGRVFDKKIGDGFDSLTKIVAVLMIYKYASAIIAVPIADKLTKMIRGKDTTPNQT